jgi:DNA-binding IclR family transcriptional regulator
MSTPEDSKAGAPRVQTAMRTAAILAEIGQSPSGLKAGEIADRLGLSRQVAYHLLHTLQSIGMLRRNEQKAYMLGLAVAPIASGFQRHLGQHEHLRAIVRQLAARSGETAHAVGWVEGEIVILCSVAGAGPIQAAEEPAGRSDNAHARASGKLLLGLASPERRARYLASHPLLAVTPATLTDPARLEASLDAARHERMAIDREEYAQGLCCLAVPLESARDEIALALSVPRDRFDARLPELSDMLRLAGRLWQ